MKRFLISLLASLMLLAGATPAPAVDYTWGGAVGRTYLRAGGEAVLGVAVSAEIKLVVNSRNTYHQHTRKGDAFGTVFWSRYLGGRTWLSPKIPNIRGVENERDALSRYGFAPVLYRSAKLCNVTTGGRQLMTTLLHNGLIIDLRSSGPATSCRDPYLPTVRRVRYSVPAHADYPRYVTGEAERLSFKRAINAFANEPGPVWIHCTAGKDRTGWAVAMIMYAAGATDAEVLEEYKRTANAPVYKLNAGLAKIKSVYGDVDTYLREGLGLTQETLDLIQAKKA